MNAYLQHGRPGEPMRTESVPVRHVPLEWQRAGLTWTATGYGARIATEHQIQVAGRWRRVYRYQYANAGTLFIGASLKAGTVVTLESAR